MKRHHARLITLSSRFESWPRNNFSGSQIQLTFLAKYTDWVYFVLGYFKNGDRMASDPVATVINRINRTRSPLRRMRLGLQFFARSKTYSREPIGWGEDCADIDDGQEVARAALRKTRRRKQKQSKRNTRRVPEIGPPTYL